MIGESRGLLLSSRSDLLIGDRPHPGVFYSMFSDYKKQHKVAYTGPTDVRYPLKYLSRNLYEEENLTLTEQLKEKIKVLKSFSIEIGAELRYQTILLHTVDDELDKTDGALRKSVSKVSRLLRGRNLCYPLYIVAFSLSVFFLIVFLGIRAKMQFF